jgi:hypothetical protein
MRGGRGAPKTARGGPGAPKMVWKEQSWRGQRPHRDGTGVDRRALSGSYVAMLQRVKTKKDRLLQENISLKEVGSSLRAASLHKANGNLAIVA